MLLFNFNSYYWFFHRNVLRTIDCWINHTINRRKCNVIDMAEMSKMTNFSQLSLPSVLCTHKHTHTLASGWCVIAIRISIRQHEGNTGCRSIVAKSCSIVLGFSVSRKMVESVNRNGKIDFYISWSRQNRLRRREKKQSIHRCVSASNSKSASHTLLCNQSIKQLRIWAYQMELGAQMETNRIYLYIFAYSVCKSRRNFPYQFN